MPSPEWKRHVNGAWSDLPNETLSAMVEARLEDATRIASTAATEAEKARMRSAILTVEEEKTAKELAYWSKRAEMVRLLEEQLAEETDEEEEVGVDGED